MENISDATKHFIDLRRHMWMAGIDVDLRRLIWQIAVTGKYIFSKIQESNRKLAGCENIYGEQQLALDMSSDEIIKHQLEFSGFVSHYASEERDSIVQVGKGGEKYIVTADPLDGSSLLDANLSIGTIIGIHESSILEGGDKSLVAAISIAYGPLITLIYSAGNGTHEFVLNREGEYVLCGEGITLRERGSILGAGGLRRDWTPGHLEYIQQLEDEGYKVRYSGAFISDIKHILIKRGGVFTYPGLKGNPEGKLRLIFELQPMAFLVEQAGGMATDGRQRILSIQPKALDQRCPIYMGSTYEVEKAKAFLGN